MPEQDQLADAAPAGSAEVFTDPRGYMAQLIMLKDRGHTPNVKFGDDEESRRFVRDVRRLNRHWKLGQIAKVPAPTVRVLPPPAASPREHRPSVPRSRRTRSARASRDGPDEPAPGRARPTELTELQQAQLLSAAAYEIARESGDRVFATFLDIEAIKVARETSRRWWDAA